MTKPAIVVVTYDRPKALTRLLSSISKADVPNDTPLIISIDFGGDSEVLAIAEEFEWNKGIKLIKKFDENIGLKSHILSCGDMTSTYGSIVLLEDDLIVSPMFYHFANASSNYYNNDKNIAGISLYSIDKHPWFNSYPFLPIDDGSDVFFLQLPESWGQVWTSNQWNKFKEWITENQTTNLLELDVPNQVKNWKNTAWSRLFIGYMIENNMYFVYPRISYSSNFGEEGVHMKKRDRRWQSNLTLARKQYNFYKFEDSEAIYDIYFEIHPRIIKKYNAFLVEFDFTVDLYGLKNIDKIETEYLLTSKISRDQLATYGLDLKPMEMNIILSNPGLEFRLTPTKNIAQTRSFDNLKLYNYYYKKFDTRHHLKMVIISIVNKLRRNQI